MRVFINYAAEDREKVEPIYDLLLLAGIAPWMDCKNLKPGDSFDEKIHDAIVDADYFIAFISVRSTTKQGYLRKEINKALTIWRHEKLQAEGYIIPIRLEECDLPKELAHLHCIDLFNETGWSILTSKLAGNPPVPLSHLTFQDTGILLESQSKSSKVDWIRIVYVNTGVRGRATDWPESVKMIHDWTWNQSPHIRWSGVEMESLEEEITGASLIVLEWISNETVENAENVCRQIRNKRNKLPILILAPDQPLRALEEFIIADEPHSKAIPEAQLAEEGQIEATFNSLGVKPKLHDLSLFISKAFKQDSDWPRNELQVSLTIQKYFPAARQATLEKNNFELHDNNLYQFTIEGQSHRYMLKLFQQKKDYQHEFEQFLEAQDWLEEAAAKLIEIPELVNQNNAFSPEQMWFPICYQVGLTPEREILTFAEAYQKESDEFVMKAFYRLLEVISKGQRGAQYTESGLWYSDFVVNVEVKETALRIFENLERYGQRVYEQLILDKNEAAKEWLSRRNTLRLITYNDLPENLGKKHPVAIGHSHGQLISINCLVNSANPDDLRLIEYGWYRNNGRLVSDLAQIECDIKLSLMSTENNATGLFDLDGGMVTRWCHAETDSIASGLDFQAASMPASPPSVKKAYSLIGKVRQRALEVSVGDKEGNHYFAALLYWTLFFLKSTSMKPTKQLLALHSVIEIIRKFES